MTTTQWTFLFIGMTFSMYLVIGWMARVRETAGFFVAGRGVPSVANGMATAADWMSAASFISMAGMISFLGSDGSKFLMGWTGGYVLLALLLAPYLRKFGKYTVPDFVGDRYGSDVARVVAVIAAIFISTTYVAGQMRGVGIVFSRFLEVPIEVGVLIGMAIVAFFSILGGMKGITWTQVAQYAVLIIAYLIPAVAISLMLTGQAVPQVAFVTSDIVPKLDASLKEMGFSAYTEAFSGSSQLNVLCVTLVLMVGTAGLPHVIVRFYTARTVQAARNSAFWALLFIALLYVTAPAIGVFARHNLIQSLHNQPLEEVQKIEWVQKWTQTKLLAFEDKNGDGLLQLNADRAINEITTIDRDIMVLATPEMAGLAPWVVALVAAGALAAALSTASGLLLVLSSSLAHDIYYRLINPKASEEQRVRVGRWMVLLGVIVAGYFGINPPGFVAEVVSLAFGLAAASFFPIILLGIFDIRMNKQGAITGMVVGLAFTLFYIVQIKAFAVAPWFFGISAEGIGVVGMLLNVGLALLVSRLTPPPSEELQELVRSIRRPENDDEQDEEDKLAAPAGH
jgi:cation/acetate symporter